MEKKLIDRRDFMKYAAFLGGGALIGAGSSLPRAASAGTRFTVATTGGSWGDAHRKIFVEGSGFMKKFDLEVFYYTAIDGVLVAKSIIHKDDPIFDVVGLNNVNAVKLRQAEANLPEWDFSIVTNWDDVYPAGKMGKFAAGYCFTNMVLTYNTKYVTKRPTSFKDLWNPKYKGHIAIPAYGWIGRYFLHLINTLFGGTVENTMPGIEALGELVKKQKPVIIANTDHGMKIMTREEAWIMPFWDGRTRQLQGRGIPVDFVWADNWIAFAQGYSVMKNSKNLKLCMEYMNSMLSPEAQAKWTQKFKYAPTNKKVKLPKELEHIRVPEKEFDKVLQIDWFKVMLDLEKNQELWNKRVLGKA